MRNDVGMKRAENDYGFEADIEKRCLLIRLRGFWNEQIIEGYRHALRKHTVNMLRLGGYKGALVDASDYGIQPQPVANGHAKAMTLARAMYGVRAAMLTSGTRPKLQMRRMADETGQRAFDRYDDALDWLLS